MPALIIRNTCKILEEATSLGVPLRRETHDCVPSKIDRIELDVRQVVQHVRVQRHAHDLVRGDLLPRHLQRQEQHPPNLLDEMSPGRENYKVDEHLPRVAYPAWQGGRGPWPGPR